MGGTCFRIVDQFSDVEGKLGVEEPKEDRGSGDGISYVAAIRAPDPRKDSDDSKSLDETRVSTGLCSSRCS